MSKNMKLIMENWQRYEQHHHILDDREYVLEVLGIDFPIQESAKMPTKVQELIVEEYTKMQSWWAPMDTLNEEGGFWSRLKDTGQGAIKLLKLMKNLINHLILVKVTIIEEAQMHLLQLELVKQV